MENLLNDLYCGKLYPCEQITPQDPDYQPLCRRNEDEMKHFVQLLSPEDARRLEEWRGHLASAASMEAYANFAYGFQLGVRLMGEAFAGKA